MEYPLKSFEISSDDLSGEEGVGCNLNIGSEFANLKHLESVNIHTAGSSFQLDGNCFLNCTGLKNVSFGSTNKFSKILGNSFKGCSAFDVAHNSVATAFKMPVNLSFGFNTSAPVLPFDSDIYIDITSGGTCYSNFKSMYSEANTSASASDTEFVRAKKFISDGHVSVDGVQVFSLA